MKLTRKQELALIDFALESLIASALNGGNVEPVKRNHHAKPPQKKTEAWRKWTPERKAKFRETMRKKWAARKAKQ